MAEIIAQEESADPSTPATGKWKLYFKAGGIYIIDDAGAVTGPLGTGGDLYPGDIVQIVYTQSGALATGTTVLPYDDTIPQITEGVEFMTLAITPTSATNKLLIEHIGHYSNSVAAYVGVALFQDATAGALAAGLQAATSASSPLIYSLRHEMVSGTTSSTTFRIRAGMHTAGTLTFNGESGARKYGGILASSIRITEIKV